MADRTYEVYAIKKGEFVEGRPTSYQTMHSQDLTTCIMKRDVHTINQ